MSPSNRAATVTVALLWLACAPAAARADDPPQNPAAPTVSIDLAASRIGGVLDFDVPILFVGPADHITEVNVRYWQPNQTLPCDSLTVPPANAGSNSWHSQARLEHPQFALSVGPLAANKQYCFLFTYKRTLADQELTTFQAEAQGALDFEFRRFQPLTVITGATLENARQRMIAAVNNAVAPLHPVSSPDSVFQPVPSDRIQTTFVNLLGPLTNAQGQVWASTSTLGDNQQVFLDRLAWVADPAAPIRRAFTALSADADAAQALAPVKDDMAALLAMSAPELAQVLVGQAPGGLAATPGPFWTTTEVDAAIGQVNGLVSKLTAARRFVALLVSAQLRTASGLTADQVTALSLSIAQSVEDVRQVLVELTLVRQNVSDRAQALAEVTKALGTQVQETVGLNGTSTADFATRSGFYVAADFGFAVAPAIGEFFPYIGLNFYLFGPVNKQAPLRGWSWKRRASATLGTTVASDLTKANERDPLFGTRMLVAGMGLRLSDSVRAVAGALVFQAHNRNPLISDTHPAATFFAAVSIDWDVKSAFERLFQ